MKKDHRQIIQRLQRDGLVVRVEHGGKHLLLYLANGRRYTSACTPGNYRGLKNMECEIKRLSRLKPEATLESLV